MEAVTTPTFPSCLNPQGATKVSYTSGTHGIVGSASEYRGSDTVYTLSDETHVQCFCSEQGDGIRTNWWKISSLSDIDIEVLKNLGWFFVPNGLLWGLDNSSYMAQNSSFACSSSGGRGGTGGTVLGASTGQVLGLATTGNSAFIVGFLMIGTSSLLAGLVLRKSS